MTARTTLGELTDEAPMVERLVGAGLSRPAARLKVPLFAACAEALMRLGVDAGAPARAMFVPGRIEVLGKHTDYAGGRSLLAATERGFSLVAVDRDDAVMRMAADAGGEVAEFRIDPELTPAEGHWSNYPMTVARRLARNFPGRLGGCDVAFAGDLPRAAGMSGSSALIVGCYLAVAAANNLHERPEYRDNIAGAEDLAGYLGTIENGQTFGTLAGDRGVGTFGGSEDHTAILCCRAGRLSQYSYSPVRFERAIDLPENYTFAIAASGVAAEKTGQAKDKYNRASALARAGVDAWNEATGRDAAHLAAAIASEGDVAEAADRIRRVLSQAQHPQFAAAQLVRRFEHFLAESEQIVPAAGDALNARDVGAFGRLVDRSQELTETLLGNQVPETVFLAARARQLGAAAASAFGAGFGGSVWALVEADAAQAFLEAWAGRYREEFPGPAGNACFFLTRPGPAAFELR